MEQAVCPTEHPRCRALLGCSGAGASLCPGSTAGPQGHQQSAQASSWVNRYNAVRSRKDRAAWATEEERAEEAMSIIPAPPPLALALPLVPRDFRSTHTHARVEAGWGHCYASPATQRGLQSSPR